VRVGRSIEDKHGVNEPDYTPSPRHDDDHDRGAEGAGHTLDGLEAFVAFVVPFAALGIAIWRFGRGDVGPGIANLILGGLGYGVAVALLATHVI
jgi:hypothetical protein